MEFELVEEESYNSQLVESSISEVGDDKKVYIKEQIKEKNKAKIEEAEKKLRAVSRSTLGRVVAEPSSSSNEVNSDFTFSSDDNIMAEIIDLTVPVTYRVKFNFSPEK